MATKTERINRPATVKTKHTKTPRNQSTASKISSFTGQLHTSLVVRHPLVVGATQVIPRHPKRFVKGWFGEHVTSREYRPVALPFWRNLIDVVGGPLENIPNLVKFPDGE